MGKTPQRVVELLQAEIPAKISKNKFCIQTGIDKNSIDKYMAGITEPTRSSLEKLAEYFKKTVPYLRGDIDEDAEFISISSIEGREYGKTPQRVVELLQAEIPAKISRNKFCIQTGINQNSIDKYMAGVIEPTQVSLEKLAKYFNKSVTYLRWNKEDEAEFDAISSVEDEKILKDLLELYRGTPGHLKKTLAILIQMVNSSVQSELDMGKNVSKETKKLVREAALIIKKHFKDVE